MSFVENLQNYKNLIDDLIERAEDFVELKKMKNFVQNILMLILPEFFIIPMIVNV